MSQPTTIPRLASRRPKLRRLLGWLTLFVLGALALVMIVPLLVETSTIRDQIITRASEGLGHEVTLDGAVRLTLLPRPAFVFDGVRIRNPRWPGGGELMSAQRIVVAPVLSDLFKGEVSLDAITLEGVHAWFERNAQGDVNWHAGPGASVMPSLDTLRGRDVVIHYREADRTASLKLDRLSGTIEGGELRAQIRGRVQALDTLISPAVLDALGIEHDGVKFSSRLSIGPGAAMELSEISLQGGKLAASGDVRMQWLRAVPAVDVRMQVDQLALPGACAGPEGGDSANRLASLLKLRPLDNTVSVPWTGAMSLDIKTLRFDELEFESVNVTAGSTPEQLTLRAVSDADAVEVGLRRAPEGVSGARVKIRAAAIRARDGLRCAGLPAGQTEGIQALGIDVEGSGATWGRMLDSLVGRVNASSRRPEKASVIVLTSIDAELADGALKTADLMLAQGSGEPIRVTASGGRLRGLVDGEWPFHASWVDDGTQLDMDVTLMRDADGAAVGGHFKGARHPGNTSTGRAAKFSGSWRHTPGAVSLSNLDVALGQSILQGDLDFDLDAQPMAVSGQLNLARTNLAWLRSLAPAGEPDGSALPDFRVNGMRILIGTLEGPPLALTGVDTRLTTQGDELRLAPLEFDMAAARWKGEATLDLASKVPVASFDMTTSKVSVDELGATAGKLGASHAANVQVRGRWSGRDLGAAASSLELDASAQRLALEDPLPRVGPVLLEDVSARYRPKSGLEATARAAVKGENLQLSMTAKPAGRDGAWTLDAQATGTPGTARMDGRWHPAGTHAGDAIDISAEGDDLARLLAVLDLSPGELAGPYQASARLTRDGDTTILSPLAFSGGGLGDVQGEARLTRKAQGRMQVTARLQSERMDLSQLLPEMSVSNAADGRKIPNAPLPPPPDLGLNADLHLNAQQVITRQGALRDVTLRVQSDEQRLSISDAGLTLESGGRLSGTVMVAAASPAPRWTIDIKGVDVDLGLLVPDSPPEDPIGWPANSSLTIEGHGKDLHELLASAQGTLEIIGQKTIVGAEDFSVWETSLLTMMLPRLGKPKRSRLNCASMDAEFADGKFTTEALLIDAENVTIAGTGSIDLTTEAIDLVLAPKPKSRGLMSGSTPVHLTGTLSDPKISVATGGLIASTSGLLLGAINPYLLLSAFIPSPADGQDAQAACERARASAENPPQAVTREASELEKSHSGGLGELLSTPFRALIGEGSTARENTPPRERTER